MEAKAKRNFVVSRVSEDIAPLPTVNQQLSFIETEAEERK